jgi:2-aminoadipate transaminase
VSTGKTTAWAADSVEAKRLARRSSVFGPSVWNEAHELVARYDDVIYFGNGAPAGETHPIERLQQAAVTAWATADPENIIVTSGSQQGIDYVARLMVDPGDLIVVEGPTYIGAMQAFDAYEPTYLTVPVDSDGMDIEALAGALDRAELKPKFIYTIPTFQNPTGNSMSRARRMALVALSRERGIPILEDDPYGEIYFDQAPERPLRALCDDVIYLGTFSKTIAPGIRVGWLVAPVDLIGMLTMVKEAADIHGDRMIMRTVFHAANHFLDGHIKRSRPIYRARRDAILSSLEEHMPPGVTWSHPEGGFFVWVTLPEGTAADELLPLAAARGVAFLPGAWFYPRGHEVRNALRLNFSTLTETRIDEGVARLGRAVTEFLQR